MFVDTVTQHGLVTVQAVAPTNPLTGDLWQSTVTHKLSVWDGTSWVAVRGGAPLMATALDVATGTDTVKILSSKLLRDELVRALGPVTAANLLAGNGATSVPDAAPTSDAAKLVALDANGKIDLGFINLAGVNFLGATDATAAPTVPTGGFKSGDIYFNNKAGTVAAGFSGAAGGFASVGDMMIFDGANWGVIAAAAGLANYLPLVGGTMTAPAVITYTVPAGAGLVTRLDGGDPLKSAIDNFTLDAGVY